MTEKRPTWRPRRSSADGELASAERRELPDSAYAFPKQRKEPLTDPSHVRNATARFDQVEDVSDTDRDVAGGAPQRDRAGPWAKKKRGADHWGVEVAEAGGRGWGEERGKARRSS